MSVDKAYLNRLYTSLRSDDSSRIIDERDFNLAFTIDSFVANQAQTLALTPSAGSGALVDVQRYPNALGAFVFLDSVDILTQEIAVTISGLQLIYNDVYGGTHPLCFVDTRTTQPGPRQLVRLIPVSILDPGLQNYGSLTLQLVFSNAAGAHPVIYNVMLALQVVYLLREPSQQFEIAGYLREIKDKHNVLADALRHIKEEMQAIKDGWQTAPDGIKHDAK